MNTDFDRTHIWHPYTSVKTPYPVNAAAESSGTKIVLEDGTELIDGIASWWCAAFGHRRGEVIDAVRKQAEAMPHVMFAGFTHGPAIALAERLKQFLPEELEHYFYADSGSVAVECALKMALQYQHETGKPERMKIASVKGGYHGDTVGAMAVSDPGGMHRIFQGILPRQYFADQPPCPFGGKWSDGTFDSMRRLLDAHAGEIAAVIIEPVFQGANAMWFYHPEYLRKLRTACDRHGIVLIFDEIAAGFWRTGRLFASEYAGVVPDIMCIGKALTAGCMTLACAAASRKIAEPIQTFLHGPTFMANPLACAAACASLDIMRSRDWGLEVARIEKAFKRNLEPFRSLPNVRDVRVLGAVGVLEVERLPDPAAIRGIVLETGVWLRPYAHFVYAMPPFVVTDRELERIAAAMGKLADVR